MKTGVVIGIVIILVVVVGGGILLWKSVATKEEAPSVEPFLTTPEIITSTPISQLSPLAPVTPTLGTVPLEGTEYIVQPKDNLWKIAKHFYNDGSESKTKLIYEANKEVIGSDPAKIKPGMKLIIPHLSRSETPPDVTSGSIDEITTRPPETSEKRPSGTKYYFVRKSDTLSEIAYRFYKNSGKKYRHLIFEANRDKLATPETTLKPGLKLTIPPLPARLDWSGGSDSDEKPSTREPTTPSGKTDKIPAPSGAPE